MTPAATLRLRLHLYIYGRKCQRCAFALRALAPRLDSHTPGSGSGAQLIIRNTHACTLPPTRPLYQPCTATLPPSHPHPRLLTFPRTLHCTFVLCFFTLISHRTWPPWPRPPLSLVSIRGPPSSPLPSTHSPPPHGLPPPSLYHRLGTHLQACPPHPATRLAYSSASLDHFSPPPPTLLQRQPAPLP